MLRAEFKLPFQIKIEILFVKTEDPAALVDCLAIDNLKSRLGIAQIKVAILPPWCVLMSVFVTFKKIKLLNDIAIGNDEERALRVQIEARHLSPGSEFSVKALNEENMVLVDISDASNCFISQIDPLLPRARHHRFAENAKP